MGQFVFARAPVPASSATLSQRETVLAPASVLLFLAYGSMLMGAVRLRRSLLLEPTNHPIAVSLLLGFPTGVNAAWLAAATGIGITLVAQVTPDMQWLAEPQGCARLLALLILIA